MGKTLYVKAVPPADLNRNTEWFMYPGVWTTYILILFFSWLIVLSLFGCSAGMAWTIVNLVHFLVTYHFFHWKKGTPFSEDQGIYNGLTWWEQMDNGQQLTRNRKFLTVVPVVLFNFYTQKLAFVLLIFHLKKCPLQLDLLLDCVTHHGLPASNAFLQHSCCARVGYCQVS